MPTLANFWTRISARFLDQVPVIIVWALGATSGTVGVILAGVASVFWELGWLISRGATPGKLLMDSRVVRIDGSPITGGRAMLRTLDIAVLSAISVVSLGASAYGRLYYVTSVILIALDSDNRRSIMDHIAGTRVVDVSA